MYEYQFYRHQDDRSCHIKNEKGKLKNNHNAVMKALLALFL